MTQELDVPVDQKKCAHSPCWCIAEAGDYYCSQECKEESTEQNHETKCGCSHQCEGREEVANIEVTHS